MEQKLLILVTEKEEGQSWNKDDYFCRNSSLSYNKYICHWNCIQEVSENCHEMHMM